MVRYKGTPKKSDDEKRKISYKLVRIGTKMRRIRRTLLVEIKRLQLSLNNCIPKGPFYRLIREILQRRCGDTNVRIQATALKALQEASEMYLVSLFEDCNLCAAHANRVTVRCNDMKLVLLIRGQHDVFNH